MVLIIIRQLLAPVVTTDEMVTRQVPRSPAANAFQSIVLVSSNLVGNLIIIGIEVVLMPG